MKRSQAVTLLKYNAWANRRVFVKAARLPPRILNAPAPLSYPSPIATLVHVLDAQWSWREGVQYGVLRKEPLRPSSFPSLSSLRRRWDEEDRLFLEFIKSRSDRQLSGTVTYTWPRARARRRPLWHILLHVSHHATQHRSELALFLTTQELSPGDLDFLDFIRAPEKR